MPFAQLPVILSGQEQILQGFLRRDFGDLGEGLVTFVKPHIREARIVSGPADTRISPLDGVVDRAAIAIARSQIDYEGNHRPWRRPRRDRPP